MGPSEWGDTARQRRNDPFHLGRLDDTVDARHAVPNSSSIPHEPRAASDPGGGDGHTPDQDCPGDAGIARLLAVGIGGAGTNAINRMIEAGVGGVEFFAMNTDAQALEMSRAPRRLRIGETLTRGLGAGGVPEIGQRAAEESYDEIQQALAGADMVFITAGMGGGTGTGASPLVAQAARDRGALTVAVVTTPFAFERKRKQIAAQGVAALREIVDALIVVPNERLMQVAAHDMSAFEAYRLADDVLRQGVQGISDLITVPGLINLDFADIRAVMADAGSALMSIGLANGENRAEVAARDAITNPLLDVDISGARGVIFNITGGDDLTMHEVNRIAEIISGAAHPDADIIFGTVHDSTIAGSLKVTVVATGFEPRVSHVTHERQLWPGVRPGAQPGAQTPQPSRGATAAPGVSDAPSPPHISSPSNPASPPRPLHSLPRAPKPPAAHMPDEQLAVSPHDADRDVQVVHDSFSVMPLERRRPDPPFSDVARSRDGALPPYLRPDEEEGDHLYPGESQHGHGVHVGYQRMPRGYHGEEFIVNDEDDDAEDHHAVETPSPLSMWGRLLNRRR